MPDLGESLLRMLASENLRSRARVFSQYDHTVRGDTILKPGDADAAVLRLRGRTDALAATLDGNSRYVVLHPRDGAALTVAEAARNLACAGARPLAVTDCLNFADPGRPEVFWEFAGSIAGLGDACRALETPVVSGNVSFYNETGELRVKPSPTVGMVGRLERAEHARGMGFRGAGDAVALAGANLGRISGSEYQMLLDGEPSGRGPGVDLDAERALVDWLVRTVELELLHSAHDVSQGGLLVALAECCLGSSKGVEVDALPGLDRLLRADALLFGEEGGRAVVSYDPADEDRLLELAAESGVPFQRLGQVTEERFRVVELVDLSLEEMLAAWRPRVGIADYRWPIDP
jgi:phosphoribosylformylglycinamidine synthase